MNPRVGLRIFLGSVSVLGLAAMFSFQRHEPTALLEIENDFQEFVIIRSLRFILNDALAILLIFAIFYKKKYVLVAMGVQLFGLLFVLIPYFILKYNLPTYNGPLISFLHRLVINPLLLLLLIPAFYYQSTRLR